MFKKIRSNLKKMAATMGFWACSSGILSVFLKFSGGITVKFPLVKSSDYPTRLFPSFSQKPLQTIKNVFLPFMVVKNLLRERRESKDRKNRLLCKFSLIFLDVSEWFRDAGFLFNKTHHFYSLFKYFKCKFD